VPEARHVELRYARTPAEWLGAVMTLAGVAMVALMVRRRRTAGPADERVVGEPEHPAREPRRPDAVPVN
jgi:hypothetical protein